MPHFVISNVYCYENRGDAAIVLSMIENIKRKYPSSHIDVLSLWPEIDEGK
jgi:polysaccharide pyruvyl transferase WcaK-like protein